MANTLSGQRLKTYLNDHLGGSTAGMELARRFAEQDAGNEYGSALREIAGELSEEREVLKSTMKTLGVDESPPKKLAGWAAEKLSRIKFSRSLHDPDLTRVLEIESLVAGVSGKRCLWQSLDILRREDERLEAFDYVGLERAAESQLERLRALRQQTL